MQMKQINKVMLTCAGEGIREHVQNVLYKSRHNELERDDVEDLIEELKEALQIAEDVLDEFEV